LEHGATLFDAHLERPNDCEKGGDFFEAARLLMNEFNNKRQSVGSRLLSLIRTKTTNHLLEVLLHSTPENGVCPSSCFSVRAHALVHENQIIVWLQVHQPQCCLVYPLAASWIFHVGAAFATDRENSLRNNICTVIVHQEFSSSSTSLVLILSFPSF
jgi:hypothetical protein